MASGQRVPAGQGRLEFRVYAPLNFGESLRVCGSTPVLGAMDHAEGVELFTSTSTYPVWSTSEAVAVFANERIEYRYAVYSGGDFSRYEDADETRFVTVRPEVRPRRVVRLV